MGSRGQADQRQWISSALVTYEERLLRYARRILRDEDQARDAVQETFLKLCHEDGAELNGRLAQWLYTVCRNQSLDMLRKETRMTGLVEERAISVQPAAPPPEAAVDLEDESSRVLHALEDLPNQQQECLRLKFEHGMSYRDIAQITGLSVSHVGVTIHAALKKLRHRLQPQQA